VTRWVVVAPYQVNHAGTVYGPGETFEARDDEVDIARRSGWLTAAPPKARRATKRAS
jgi:hypothetical protein